MPSNHLILCCPLLLLPSIFPSIRVFSNESALCILWPKYWSFSIRISLANDYSGLISFRIDWFDLPEVLGTLWSPWPTLGNTIEFSSVQSISHVRLLVTPQTAARQASLSITNSWSLLKLRSIELMMPSNHLILCHPLLLLPSNLPESGSFPRNQFFASGGQSIGTSASASVFSKIIQNWFPLGLTGLISLQSKGLSRVFSNTTDQSIDFLALSFLYDPTLISIHD